jgi:hypothetical protein
MEKSKVGRRGKKSNLAGFGLNKGNEVRYEDTQKIVEQLIKEKMGIQEVQEHTDC